MKSNRIAFIAAMEWEVKPLVRRWRSVRHDGWSYKFFESGEKVIVCAGIGMEAARRATETVVQLFSPAKIWSIGFAGALEQGMPVGKVICPRRVVDASDGSSLETGGSDGVLVSYSSTAGVEQKRRLARAYAAQAVDMEAAAVARGAQTHGIAFGACKVISDTSEFEMLDMDRFVRNGEFRTLAFLAHVLIRPWSWPGVIQLGRNSARAAKNLCSWLMQYSAAVESLENKPAELHPK